MVGCRLRCCCYRATGASSGAAGGMFQVLVHSVESSGRVSPTACLILVGLEVVSLKSRQKQREESVRYSGVELDIYVRSYKMAKRALQSTFSITNQCNTN